jgi:hypothetical protein
MNQSESIAELAAAMAKAQGAFDHAKKDVSNAFFKSKYADLASVIDAAKKPLADNGLTVIQTTEFDESNGVFLITTLAHSSGQWISGRYPVNPVKNDPQSFGSAITYARRYCFSAITGIAADDDDGNAASGNHSETQHSNELPWLNLSPKMLASMKSAIESGERTADQIIANMSKDHRISKATKDQIKALSEVAA